MSEHGDHAAASEVRVPATVGVAFSGGGYRAAAWGLGSYLALSALRRAEAMGDAAPKIAQVASVSGGSITNAAFGIGLDLAAAPPESIDQRTAALAPGFVGRRWAFKPVLLLMAAIHIGIGGWASGWESHDGYRWAAATALATAVGLLFGPACKDLLFGWWPAWLYVGGAVGGISATIWILWLDWPTSHRLGWSAIALVCTAVYLWPRPYLVARAFDSTFRSWNGGATPTTFDLSAPPAGEDRKAVHVIITTELSGKHLLYMGSGFSYNDDHGRSVTSNLAAAAAVQSSSNLPGAFPVRWLMNGKLRLTEGRPTRRGRRQANAQPRRFLPVTDGGVYDNMGSQWFTGLERRLRSLGRDTAESEIAATIHGMLAVPDAVLLVNASGPGRTKRTPLSAIPLLGWVVGLLRIKTVMYEQTTASRRSEAIESFDAEDPPGLLVHIQTSPGGYVSEMAKPKYANAAAQAAKGQLVGVGERDWWGEARDNGAVTTAFWPLKGDDIARVVQHAYLQTLLGMHVKFGTPYRLPAVDEFTELVEGRPRQGIGGWLP